MPFAVIVRVNVVGKNELFVVPDKWLRSSRNGSIVLWPNSTCATDQENYFRDESMCPGRSWQKYKCIVKRYPIASYERALGILETLLEKSLKLSPRIHDVSGEPLNGLEPKEPMNKSKGECFFGSKRKLSVEKKNDLPLTSIKEYNGPLPVIISAYSEANSENTAFVASDQPRTHSELEVNAANLFQKCMVKMNEILQLQHLLNARFDKLEAKVTEISNQTKFILNASKNCCKRPSIIEETLSFTFVPMESEQQLIELESKLEDYEYREKLLRWLRLNASGVCAEDRMLGVLDLLFSKKFQTMCTWTGISRKGPKTAVMPNRNILGIFQIIGSGESEEVGQRELANFFMKKLKNSLKRLHISGLRRATRHVRARKPEEQKQSNQCDISDDSSSNSVDEHESYSVYTEESGSSDSTSAGYSVVKSESNNHFMA